MRTKFQSSPLPEILYIPKFQTVPDGLFDTRQINCVDTALKIAQRPSHQIRAGLPSLKLRRWKLNDVAAHAVMRWVSSEEAMECIDKAVNALLQSEE